MNLNLNDPNEFTIEGVRRLLASKTGLESDGSVPGSDPGGMYRLWVTRACYELGRKSHRNADFTVSLVPSRSPFPAFLSRF
jgi:hypothetical protein